MYTYIYIYYDTVFRGPPFPMVEKQELNFWEESIPIFPLERCDTDWRGWFCKDVGFKICTNFFLIDFFCNRYFLIFFGRLTLVMILIGLDISSHLYFS